MRAYCIKCEMEPPCRCKDGIPYLSEPPATRATDPGFLGDVNASISELTHYLARTNAALRETQLALVEVTARVYDLERAVDGLRARGTRSGQRAPARLSRGKKK